MGVGGEMITLKLAKSSLQSKMCTRSSMQAVIACIWSTVYLVLPLPF